MILEEEKEPNYLNAGVGEYAVFNCDLDFPHETPIPYILQWNRDVSPPFSFQKTILETVDIYIGNDCCIYFDSRDRERREEEERNLPS